MTSRPLQWELDPFEERLLERLRADVTEQAAAGALVGVSARRSVARSRRVRRSAWAVVAVAVAGCAVAFALLSSGSAPTPALALPILSTPTVGLPIPPAEVARVLREPTARLQGGPVNTHVGHKIADPLGPTYVLTDPRHQIVCVLLHPIGLRTQQGAFGWNANCAGPQTLAHTGAQFSYYARNRPALNVAILLAGSTLTAQHPGGRPRRIRLHHEVAVTVIHQTTVFTARINGHISRTVDWIYPGSLGVSQPPRSLRRAVQKIERGAY